MIKFHPTVLILLLSSLSLISCQNGITITLNSGIGEQRKVDLSSLGIATGSYTPTDTSPDDTVFQQIQPIDFETVQGYEFIEVISSFELYLGSGSTQKAQLYSDASETLSLAIFSIQKFTGSPQTITSSNPFNVYNLLNPDGTLEVMYPLVALYSSGQGILVYQLKNQSFMQFFSLNGQDIVFQTASPYAQSTNSTDIFPFSSNNGFYYLSFDQSSQTITLYQYLSNILGVESNIKVCQLFENGKATSLRNSGVLAIRCDYENNPTFFEEYSINPSDSAIQVYISSQAQYYQVGKVLRSSFFLNTLYILEYISGSLNALQLTLLTKQYQVLQSTSYILAFPENVNTIISAFISEGGDLVTVLTSNSVIGISVLSQSAVFQYSVSTVIQDYNPGTNEFVITAQQYCAQIILTIAFGKPGNLLFTSSALSTHIPVFIFSQGQNQQTYSVYLTNDPLKKTLDIISNPFEEPPVTFLSDPIQNYSISPGGQGIVNINIENYVLGSDFSLSLEEFSNTDAVTTTATFLDKYQEISCESIADVSNITNISSTNTDYVLVESTTSQNGAPLYTYSFSLFILQKSVTLTPFFSLQSTNQVASVDSSGSFTLNEPSVYWKVYTIISEVKGKISSITTQCLRSNSFIFQVDISNRILATICNNVIFIYQIYYYNQSIKVNVVQLNYPTTITLPIVASILLKSNGIFLITDNISVYGFDAIHGVYIGMTNVPIAVQAENNPKIFLFSNSFIYGTNDGLFQLSYNFGYDPNNQDFVSFADELRELTSLQYDWAIEPDYSNIKQATNYLLDREILLVPATTEQGANNFYLLYRLDGIISQNQLYTSIPYTPTSVQFWFTLNQLIGYLSLENGLLLINYSYYAILQVQYQTVDKLFQQDTTFLSSSTITDQSEMTNGFKFILQRDVSSVNGKININSQVQNLQNFFLSNPLQDGAIISFNDSSFFNSNLLGWQLPQVFNSVHLTANIQQRATIGTQTNSNDYTEMLTIMPNFVIYATNKAIIIDGENTFTIDGEQNNKVTFFIDESQTDIAHQQDTIIQTVTVYAIILQDNIHGITLLNKYVIVGTYSDIQGTPTIEVTSNNSYTYQTKLTNLFLANCYKAISILSDPILGLITLIQPFGSTTSNVYLLSIDGTSFTLQPFTNLSSLQIVNYLFSDSLDSTLFFSQNGYLYYSFTSASSATYQDLTTILISQGVNLSSNSVISAVTKLSPDGYLIEYDGSSLFFVTLLQLGKNSSNELIVNSIYVLYQESNLQFTGFAYTDSPDKQIIVVSQVLETPNQFAFLVFEPFDLNFEIVNNYLIRSSGLYTITSNIQSFRFAEAPNGTLIQVLAQNDGFQEQQLLSMQLQSNVQVSITSTQVQNGFSGNAFGISPLLTIPNNGNTILFQANQSGGDTPVASGNILRGCLGILALMMIMI